jgi:hypothetical protein
MRLYHYRDGVWSTYWGGITIDSLELSEIGVDLSFFDIKIDPEFIFGSQLCHPPFCYLSISYFIKSWKHIHFSLSYM